MFHSQEHKPNAIEHLEPISVIRSYYFILVKHLTTDLTKLSVILFLLLIIKLIKYDCVKAQPPAAILQSAQTFEQTKNMDDHRKSPQKLDFYQKSVSGLFG